MLILLCIVVIFLCFMVLFSLVSVSNYEDNFGCHLETITSLNLICLELRNIKSTIFIISLLLIYLK